MTDASFVGEVPMVKVHSVHYGDLAKRERELYEKVWADIPEYGEVSPGLDAVDQFIDVLKPPFGASILDVGCGTGAAGLKLTERGLSVHYLDITDAGLDPRIKRSRFIEQPLWKPFGDAQFWDFVYCCDVMEHIHEEFSMLAVNNLLQHCSDRAWFQVALVADEFGKAIGQPLHVNVKDFVWWRDHLAALGNLVEARDMGMKAVYVVERR